MLRTVLAFNPRLRIVSIIPGIEIAAPERTETRSGSSGSPKRLPLSSRLYQPIPTSSPPVSIGVVLQKLGRLDEALAAFQPGTDSTSLQYMAKQINPFLVKSGLTKKEAALKGLFAPQFTQAYLDGHPSTTTTAPSS